MALPSSTLPCRALFLLCSVAENWSYWGLSTRWGDIHTSPEQLLTPLHTLLANTLLKAYGLFISCLFISEHPLALLHILLTNTLLKGYGFLLEQCAFRCLICRQLKQGSGTLTAGPVGQRSGAGCLKGGAINGRGDGKPKLPANCGSWKPQHDCGSVLFLLPGCFCLWQFFNSTAFSTSSILFTSFSLSASSSCWQPYSDLSARQMSFWCSAIAFAPCWSCSFAVLRVVVLCVAVGLIFSKTLVADWMQSFMPLLKKCCFCYPCSRITAPREPIKHVNSLYTCIYIYYSGRFFPSYSQAHQLYTCVYNILQWEIFSVLFASSFNIKYINFENLLLKAAYQIII